jgi:hypothetical protein
MNRVRFYRMAPLGWGKSRGMNRKRAERGGGCLSQFLFRIWYLCWNLTMTGDECAGMVRGSIKASALPLMQASALQSIRSLCCRTALGLAQSVFSWRPPD